MSKGRRTARVSVAVAAAGVVALAGCAPEDVDGPDSAEEGEEQEETFLQLATGSTGGTYYPLGGEIAQLWSDNIDNVQVDSFATGASVQNMRALEGETEDEEEGEAEQSELVMAVNGTAMEAVDGEGAFADEPMDNPEGLMTLGKIGRAHV